MANSGKPRRIDASAAALPAAVASCLERHIDPGHRIVLGLSGGIDSVSLLHALASGFFRKGMLASLSALHVHHAISPNADDWEVFCRRFCERLGISFASLRVTVPRGTRDGLEAAARRVRHAAFAQADADWIMLAHHRNDQAETLLFNLLRGTGVAGAAAMRERSGRILRPLLPVGRQEIELYARQHGLVWIEDESNADIRHSRNFLRQKIFPELERRIPAASRNLSAAAVRFAETQDLLDDLARLDLGDEAGFPLSAQAFAALGEPRARNLLRFLLARHGVQIPSEARLREAVRQLQAAGIDKHPSVTLGEHRLLRRRGQIYLERNLSSEDKR
jgi:tRNA(Ile)-lysidine synthase